METAQTVMVIISGSLIVGLVILGFRTVHLGGRQLVEALQKLNATLSGIQSSLQQLHEQRMGRKKDRPESNSKANGGTPS